MRKEILRLEQIFSPPWLFGLNMDVYAGELDALIGIDYLGLDYLLALIQHNLPIHYGRVFYDGKRVNDEESRIRKTNRIVILKKKTTLIDSLTVAENLFVIRSGYKKQFINYRMLIRQTESILRPLGLFVQPMTLVSALSPCEKWIIELAKAWVSGVKLVILCDLSNFVTNADLIRIIRVVRQLAGRKMAFLYICNHHQEAFRFCDRCFLMKQGQIVKCLEKEQMKDDIILHYSYVFENWVQNERRRKLFEHTRPDQSEGFFCKFGDFSFTMKKGESVVLLDSDSRIIGSLFNLLQSGKRIDSSVLRVDGGPWDPKSPRVSLIPSRPTVSMLFPQLSVLDNLCFTIDHKVRNFWLNDRKKKAIAQDLFPIFNDAIYASSLSGLDDPLLYDIVYQRILLQHPSFVCVMQPLASVDMMMRLHLLAYFDKFREKGITVCILAFALSDSLEIANRLLVIRNGKIDREYQRSNFSSYPGISGSRPAET